MLRNRIVSWKAHGNMFSSKHLAQVEEEDEVLDDDSMQIFDFCPAQVEVQAIVDHPHASSEAGSYETRPTRNQHSELQSMSLDAEEQYLDGTEQALTSEVTVLTCRQQPACQQLETLAHYVISELRRNPGSPACPKGHAILSCSSTYRSGRCDICYCDSSGVFCRECGFDLCSACLDAGVVELRPQVAQVEVAYQAIEAGNREEGMAHLTEAWHMLQALPESDLPSVGGIRCRAAFLLGLFSEDWPRRVMFLKEALHVHREILGNSDTRAAYLLLHLGKANYCMGQYEAAQQHLKDYLVIQRNLHGPQTYGFAAHAGIADGLLFCGYALLDMGKRSDALRYLHKYLRVIRTVPGEQPARIYYLLGCIYGNNGEYKNAQKNFETAIRESDEDLEVACRSLQDLLIMSWQQGDLGAARRHASQMLKFMKEKCFDPTLLSSIESTPFCMNRAAWIMAETGHMRESMFFMRKSRNMPLPGFFPLLLHQAAASDWNIVFLNTLSLLVTSF